MHFSFISLTPVVPNPHGTPSRQVPSDDALKAYKAIVKVETRTGYQGAV